MGFAETKETWFLNKLLSILDEVDQELPFFPIPDSGLRWFVTFKYSTFAREDAGNVLQTVRDMWPEKIDDVTLERILRFRKALLYKE